VAKKEGFLPVVATPRLRFRIDAVDSDKPSESGGHTMADNLSAAAFVDGRLHVGGDEGDLVAVLDSDGRGGFFEQDAAGRIAVYGLVDRLKKGVGPDGETIRVGREIDIEGLAFEDDSLWVVGSHAWRRKRIPRGTEPAEALARIERGVEPQFGRCLLARLDVGDPDNGDHRRLSAHRRHGDILSAAVAAHPVLGTFARQSSKENGLDIEGLAVRKRRLMLGCRGPVVGGFAAILDLKLAEDSGELVFADPDKALAVHYLRLDGFGVRDLARDGDDLLILSGPTMEAPGAAAIWRWREAFGVRRADHVEPDGPAPALRKIGQIEGTGPKGKPEAICFMPGEPDRLLVLRDGAAKGASDGQITVEAEVVAIAG
jgi:hypothetical protein